MFQSRMKQVSYLWKELVLFGDLVKHLVSLDGWFQVSSQHLRDSSVIGLRARGAAATAAGVLPARYS